MAEYIEREATLHRMKVEIRPPFAVVRDMPAADVAEVVRCKECTELGRCPIHYFHLKSGDSFCSNGKRKG